MPSRRSTSRGRPLHGGESPLTDSVDRIVAEWAVERPDLPVAPVEVITRLARVRLRLDEELAATFARHDLSSADFTVIAALRRAGAPYVLPQNALMARLGLTSGTVSVRLARLEGKGVVTRAPARDDGRGVEVTLTATGQELFDRVAPDHLATEDVLLSALLPDERAQLAGLLRRLLVGFEHEHAASPLGIVVEPAHRARRARAAVGLSDRAGLLVERVEPESPADRAGLRPGDLLVGLADRPLVSCTDLAAATVAARGGPPLDLRVVRGETEFDVVVGA